MKYRYLDDINSVADVKALSQTEVDDLCDEIRDFLVEKTKQSGGHLASNLGVVELSPVSVHVTFPTSIVVLVFTLLLSSVSVPNGNSTFVSPLIVPNVLNVNL